MKKLFIIGLASATLLSSCGGKKFLISASGENLTALTKVTDNEEPCESPYGGDNGKDLFFAAKEKGGYWNIYKKDNPFSNAMSQKTNGKNFNTSPAYCAAIDKIAFSSQMEGQNSADIYLMPNNQGKTLSPVTESSNAREDNPSFSKDGKFLVYDKVISTLYKRGGFLSFGGGITVVRSSEIWLKNLETGESILLGNGAQPSFSPNGKGIVFVKYSSDAKSCSIWTMDIDGGNTVQITDAKKGYAYYPRYNPSGDKIIFQASKKDKKDADIYIIDADGNNLTQLTINKSYDGQPYWTEDGYIYFVSDRGDKSGKRQIWRFKL